MTTLPKLVVLRDAISHQYLSADGTFVHRTYALRMTSETAHKIAKFGCPGSHWYVIEECSKYERRTAVWIEGQEEILALKTQRQRLLADAAKLTQEGSSLEKYARLLLTQAEDLKEKAYNIEVSLRLMK